MIDTSFDIVHWIFWKNLLFWSVNIIAIISLFISVSYSYSKKTKTTFPALCLYVLLYILLGNYPIEWGLHTDREHYAIYFLEFFYNKQQIDYSQSEVGYQIIQYILSRFLTVQQFFLALTFIYLTNYYIAIKKIVKRNIYWLFLIVTLSMGFISYNLNTMRAGLAISFMILGLSLYKSKLKLAICLIIAVSVHTSTIIPSTIIGICYFFNKTSLYIKLWFLSIILSLIGGNYFNELFSGLSEDSRTDYLTTENSHYNSGFRIDFIIYSLVPLIIGWLYLAKYNYKDRFYSILYNSYILTNIFWVLVIRASYSDRFAYLSWCLIPFILGYPLLTQKLKLKENYWLSLIILGEVLFKFII